MTSEKDICPGPRKPDPYDGDRRGKRYNRGMTPVMSRREFLKLAASGLGGLAASPLLSRLHTPAGLEVVRVTVSQVKIYRQPDTRSEVVYTRSRDELMNVYYQLTADSGRNPLWYRVWGGYAHSSFLHPARFCYNTPLTSIPASGLLVEVSMPYTRSMIYDTRQKQWLPNYRLYYGSTHWVTAVEPGPDGQPWYRIKDHYDRFYWADAVHLHPIPAEELAPISPGLDPADKYIRVSLGEQTLTAYEQGKVVLETRISSGIPPADGVTVPEGEISPATPLGDFHITVKTPTRHMGDKKLTGEIETTALPGVPWVSFFDEKGYSLHGTFWHNNFGYRMSHGCVNMRTEDARWIYRWTEPHVPVDVPWFSQWGTRVSVVD